MYGLVDELQELRAENAKLKEVLADLVKAVENEAGDNAWDPPLPSSAAALARAKEAL